MQITKRNISRILKKDISYDTIEIIREEIEKQFYLTDNKNTKTHLRMYGDTLYFLQNNLKEDFNKILEHYNKKAYELKSQAMQLIKQNKEIKEEEIEINNKMRLIQYNIDELKLILELTK